MYIKETVNNESLVLVSVDIFVQEVCRGLYLNVIEFKMKLIDLIESFKAIRLNNIWCVQTIEVFKSVILIVESILYQNEWNDYVDILKFEDGHIDKIFKCIMGYKKHIDNQIDLFESQEEHNRFKLHGYISNLINHYSRLLFVRVDLGILQEYQQHWNIERIKEALSILRNRISNKDTCFDGLQGYAWALEQGMTKGYHIHLLLIYDGNKHQQDSALGKLVGECWQNITNQQGNYYNCNTNEHKANFESNNLLGIGMIHRHNELEVSNAIRTSLYLVNHEKENQYLRVKTSKNMKTFGTGQFHVSWRRGIKI